MADLSALGNLNPVQELNLSDGEYQVAKESTFQLPTAGKYTLRAPESFPSTAFSRTKNGGHLLIQIDPTIASGDREGFQVRYQRVSAKQFDRGGKSVSQAGDYLRACGFKGTIKNEQELADAIESTAGLTYEAKLDWQARNNRTGYEVTGMTKFPKNADGTYQSWVEDPTETDENGKAKRLRANLVIPFGGFIDKN